jgi:hypothetical protein
VPAQSGVFINNMMNSSSMNNKSGAGSSFNTHGSGSSNPQSNLLERLQNNSNIHDASPSYLL